MFAPLLGHAEAMVQSDPFKGIEPANRICYDPEYIAHEVIMY